MNDKFRKGNKVRYLADGKVGEITGNYRERFDAWEVLFNGVDSFYIPSEKLDLVGERKNVYELFNDKEFMTITDFRRRIYRYRMSGELTNLMYSMDNATTKFMPHQFIPVIKFLESYTDRLLIADEVGLGKTIEAMYIWEELVARKNAKRLLVVAPAVLREKWRGDIRRFFNIDAEIVSPQKENSSLTLLRRIHDAIDDPARTNFAIIVSLEGLRTAGDVLSELEKCRDDKMLFDMTIIDEAHYMRNSTTASFKAGELLRDVSRHFVLLSATPIQTSSKNLFNLLNLLSPEDFSYPETFAEQLCENRPLVRLANSLERGDDEEDVRASIEDALRSPVFSNDTDIRRLSESLPAVLSDMNKRVAMVDCLKGKYFYSGFITRSRKRDVIQNRVRRNVVSVNFRLSDYEREFYDEVSAYLREQDVQSGNSNVSTFRLISRQRQMASSIPAALKAWRRVCPDDSGDEIADEEDDLAGGTVSMPLFDKFSLAELEANDSKFESVASEITRILSENPDEKIVIFSFFRGTVQYLYERLNKAGISSTYILGGQSMADKQQRLEDFEKNAVNVLVSSEVGSEGIDLQFARYELNYDLPWNPMRLEQRIGRIDRIGQASPDIYICNAYCENTIADRILARLYQRIEVFRNVIGDLEEVMGEQVRNLEVDIFREHRELTDKDVEERAQQCVNAICRRNQMTESLELHAGNMASPYQEFILRNIGKAYAAKRLLTSEELMFFCRDVLQEMFQGSSVTRIGDSSMAEVRLSDAARRGLSLFQANNPLAYGTQLSSVSNVPVCNFGRKIVSGSMGENATVSEIIDIHHPLVRWLLSIVEQNAIYSSGCDVIEINRSSLPKDIQIEPGYYAYSIQRWKSDGVRKINELRYCLCQGVMDDGGREKLIDGSDAESIMVSVVIGGSAYDVVLLEDSDFNACGLAMERVDAHLEESFCEFAAQQKERNRDLVEEQIKYVERTASAKSGKLRATIDKLRINMEQGLVASSNVGKYEGLVKANEKKIENIVARRDARLASIKSKLDCNPVFEDVAIGILYVKEV